MVFFVFFAALASPHVLGATCGPPVGATTPTEPTRPPLTRVGRNWAGPASHGDGVTHGGALANGMYGSMGPGATAGVYDQATDGGVPVAAEAEAEADAGAYAGVGTAGLGLGNVSTPADDGTYGDMANEAYGDPDQAADGTYGDMSNEAYGDPDQAGFLGIVQGDVLGGFGNTNDLEL